MSDIAHHVQPVPLSRHAQHQRLLTVAVELFAGQGYAAIGLRELARHLNMQAGSLYHHFQSKQELLFELIESALSDLLQATLRQLKTCTTPAQRLHGFMEVFVQFRSSDGPRLELVAREYLYLNGEQKREVDQLRARYVELLQSILAPRTAGSVQATLIVAMLFNAWGWQGVPLQGLSTLLVQLVQGMTSGRPLAVSA